MIFSPLNPAKLNNRRGKENSIKITIFVFILLNKRLTIRKTNKYQSMLTIAVV